MPNSRPVVVRPDERMVTPATPGLGEHQFFAADGRWAGFAAWIRNEAGDVSGWHHHAANETFVYVIRGSVTIHFGPDGAESVTARPGEFLVIPAHTVHRETTGSDADLEAMVLRFGREPEQVDVGGPEAVPG